MNILAIETSCDETAVSIIAGSGDFPEPEFKTLAHIVSSQVKLHAEFGGVVPMLAKREHARNLIPVLQQALDQAGSLEKKPETESEKVSPELQNKLERILEREPELLQHFLTFITQFSKPNIAAVSVTRGPGLEPALWVGVNLARALALAWELPIVPVDHMEGHLLSPLANYHTKLELPVLALLISGGHTELVLMKSWLKYEKLGQTRDDAVGEAFDKVARILDLPYPGGPEIGKLAAQADQDNLPDLDEKLPRPMLNSDNLDFSFSGLKTAVLYLVKKIAKLDEAKKQQIAREFQQAVIEVLISKTVKAIHAHQPKTLVIAGGVVANQELVKQFKTKISQDFPDLNLLTPEFKLATDNATMIAIAGYFHTIKKDFADPDLLTANGNLTLAV